MSAAEEQPRLVYDAPTGEWIPMEYDPATGAWIRIGRWKMSAADEESARLAYESEIPDGPQRNLGGGRWVSISLERLASRCRRIRRPSAGRARRRSRRATHRRVQRAADGDGEGGASPPPPPSDHQHHHHQHHPHHPHQHHLAPRSRCAS